MQRDRLVGAGGHAQEVTVVRIVRRELGVVCC